MVHCLWFWDGVDMAGRSLSCYELMVYIILRTFAWNTSLLLLLLGSGWHTAVYVYMWVYYGLITVIGYGDISMWFSQIKDDYDDDDDHDNANWIATNPTPDLEPK